MVIITGCEWMIAGSAAYRNLLSSGGRPQATAAGDESDEDDIEQMLAVTPRTEPKIGNV